jgi:hypothetical protein
VAREAWREDEVSFYEMSLIAIWLLNYDMRIVSCAEVKESAMGPDGLFA